MCVLVAKTYFSRIKLGIEVLVLVINERESELVEMLGDSALAIVRVVNSQLRLWFSQLLC
jgi:hypothetical protein